MRSRVLLLSALCLLPGAARAFVRGRTAQGIPLRRGDSNQIPYLISDRTAAGLTNSSGSVVITTDSDPVAALQAAMDNWSTAGASTAAFGTAALSSLQSATTSQPDGQHLITFADTPENRSALGNGTIAITRIFFVPSTGEIVDTDTIFNPQFSYSTTLQPGTYDIEAVATHELGHALGASHSGVLGASMFFSTRRGVPDARLLTSDDLAFLTEAYPASNAASGAITGTITLAEGGVARGALVTAVDPASGVAVGSVTAANGVYTIPRVPPGQYVVYVEPMDGPVEPNQVSEITGANVNFSTAVLGGAADPARLAVSAGATAQADLTVESGFPAMNITQGGSGVVGGPITFSSGAFPLTRGASSDVLLIGRGLDDAAISEASISFLGAPIRLRAGSLQRGTNPSNGLPFLRFTVQVTADAALGLQTVAVRGANAVSVFSGGVRVAPPAPAFTAAAVVDAASFASGGVAPGEIVSIFGSNLGPPEGAGAARNRGTGLLSDSVANVTVTFNGVRAPLYYVSQGQINAQAPFEIAGQSTAQVAVRYHLVANQPVPVNVAAARPGLFCFDGPSPRRVVALNQDGSVNSPENPAPRGQVVVLFATGQGAVNPVVGTGQFALSAPLSSATLQTAATVGGVPAEVQFSGLAPGFVGLLQVNVRIPDNTRAGADVPVRLTVGEASSQSDAILAVR